MPKREYFISSITIIFKNFGSILVVSQKYHTLDKLEEMIEYRDSYLEEFEKTGSRAAKIRYEFLNKKIYGVLYRRALKEYNALFKTRGAFSMNRKT